MRIVKRPEFLTLPIGTVYSHYTPCVTHGFAVKDEPCGENDWWYADLEGVSVVQAESSSDMTDRLIDMEEHGTSAPADYNALSRDGSFGDSTELFLIYERSDILRLIERLERAIT